MTAAEAAQYILDYPRAHVLHETKSGCYFSDIYRREGVGYTYMNWEGEQIELMGVELVDVYQEIPEEIVPVSPTLISDTPAAIVTPTLAEQIAEQMERINALRTALTEETDRLETLIAKLQTAILQQPSPIGEISPAV
jgi:hypothetical protein